MENSLKILMLEDSPFDVELIQFLLKSNMPDVVFQVISDKTDFEPVLKQFSPDIILSDNSLTDMDARVALQISRSIIPHIPFIMVSGTVSEEFATDIIRSGADDYILKDRLARLPMSIDTAIKTRKSEKEKYQALDLLKINEEKYRMLVERVTDAFIALDNNFCYTFLNKQAGELIQRDPATMLGKNVWEEFPDAVGSNTYHSFMKAMNEQVNITSTDYYEPFDLWQENHIYASPEGLSIFIRDITKQKKSQEALQAMERDAMDQKIREQKRITKAIISAQEKERNRIGQELHDNVNQILAASKMFLVSAGQDNHELVRYPIELIDSCIQEIRELSHRNVTPVKNVDLKELIQLQLNRLTENAGIKTDLFYTVEEKLTDDDLKLNIYRIIQEQLSNILKYASAKNVQVMLAVHTNEIHLQIIDDGVGFDKTQMRTGVGISNMINRIETFNGAFELISSPGKGCIIQVTIPYH
jgi:two-component system sensor histidine kinase UhpB